MSEPREDQTTNNNTPNPFAEIVEMANATEMSTKEAYFASLREWAKQAYIAQTAMPIWCCPACNWPSTVHAGTVDAGTVDAGTSTPQSDSHPDGSFPIAMLLNADQLVQSPGGYHYSVAPMAKRFLAEFIDIMITLFIKVFVMIMLLNFVEMEFGREEMQMALEEEFAFGFTRTSSDLWIINLIVAILAWVFEAVCGSATPGNRIMQLRILKVKTVMYLRDGYEPDYQDFVNFQNDEPLHVLIYPIETPSVLRMFLRAVLKHIIVRAFFDRVLLVILLPLSVVVMFYNYNRSIHDVLTSTIVVEKKPNHPYRFQVPMRQRQ
ncbi:uncharacterized protein Dwil_GK17239 [Drosophila willistoni]|uniref:RDD domain-containing protein n=1 Tax=Drosophila willistoni TaxID=7260 RepID=B4MLL6_DROWI|nr:uncharacterized protein LOC6638845 [Drosophila willistoni]EDW72872.1 uncharacterized protein Dwil_GK17239 [Drosophila willistoni]